MSGGPRISPAAIDRNRASSRARYHQNKPYNQKVQKVYRDRRFEEREFIGWDGEGYNAYEVDSQGVCIPRHRYMLFGCSAGYRHITSIDLGTQECLDLVLEIERENPDAYHVGYSFEYDVNMILKDLPWRMLAVLKITGHVRWKGYKIAHVPHKMFTISQGDVSATIYDGFGFFHSKYIHALRKYGVGSADKLARIDAGKNSRGRFTYADLPEVKSYWKDEISLYPELFDCVRTAAYRGGFRIHKWHGPGALAAYALGYNHVSTYMSRSVPANVRAAIRAAYAGGRFQAWRCGWYEGPVYTLDKNSAYVQAIAELPNLARGKWVRRDPSTIKRSDDLARFGIYHVVFDDFDSGRDKTIRARGVPARPYPLFHRDRNGRLTWPSRVDGWFWTPEAKLVAGNEHATFLEAFEFEDDGSYPFRWVKDSYEVRRILKDPEHYDPAEKAYKWGLAALYGAFARRVGWDRKTRTAPRTHELAWAGFITSHCRAAIFEVAQYAAKKGGLISVDTDGVTATVPFPESLVPEGFGDGLGQWKQDEYDAILYWQNGIYWLRDGKTGEWADAKSRGVPRGVISIHDAMVALEGASFRHPYKPAQIVTTRTRFVGYRQALKGQHDKWRQWLTEPNVITFGGTGKGTHIPPFCGACKYGKGMHIVTHLPPKDMVSTEHKLPWLEPEPDETVGEWTELGSDIFGTEDDIFYDGDLDDRL
jgi:hypothetical protein